MYDVIVIGTGGVGSAAMYHLACGGLRVLGLDRFPAGHDKGSSHGESRIIRRSYFEHPNYVPLLNSAYKLWDELQATTGQRQIHRTGLLYSGVRDGIVIQGVLQSAMQHSLQVEQLTPA
jgi:sarcosine oxidase